MTSLLSHSAEFPERVAAEAVRLGFDPDVVAALRASAGRVAGTRTGWDDFRAAAEPWLEGRSESPPPGTPAEMLPLIVIAGFSLMEHRHREKGIPAKITTATAFDLQRWLLESLAKTGQAEIPGLQWFANHIHRGLLEIGRLQFLAAPFGAPYRIYRGEGRRPLAVAEDGLACDPDGWLPRGATGFHTECRGTDEGGLVAHRVNHRTGAIARRAEVFPGPLDLAADRNTPVLHIHVPSGPGLTPATCRESLAMAGEVFRQTCPEWELPLFSCTSWLCDPELEKCLPPDSQIVQFGKLFRPLATPGTNFRQLIQRVLDGCEDWETFQPRTSLQNAVLGHLRSGGTFRTTTGYILRSS